MSALAAGIDSPRRGGAADTVALADAPATEEITGGTAPAAAESSTLATSDGVTSAAPRQSSNGGSAEPRTSASPAVTDGGDVPLGILLLDLTGGQQIGFQAPGASAEEERKAYDAFIGLVNDGGGIAGRRIVPFYRTFNPLNPDSMQAACVALAQDGKVFAAIAGPGFFNQQTLCLTERFGIPTISYQPESEDWQRRSRGLLVTQHMSTHRMMRSLVHMAQQQGRLARRTIGIVTSKAPADLEATKGALEPALADLGYRVAHTSVLAERTGDGAPQIPVEIVEMRRKGVDLVLFATSALYFGMWANEAEAQQFRPLYLGSDVGGVSDDFAVQNAPASLAAFAYSTDRGGEYRLKRPEAPADARCHQRYRERTGATLDRSKSAGYQTAVRACGYIDLFTAAARRAATDGLSRASYLGALRSLGAWELPFSGPGSLRPDKLGIADSVRTKQYRGDCRCWIPVDDFTAAPA